MVKGKKAIHVQWQGTMKMKKKTEKKYKDTKTMKKKQIDRGIFLFVVQQSHQKLFGASTKKKMSFGSSQYCLMRYEEKKA